MKQWAVSLFVILAFTAKADTFSFAIDEFPPYVDSQAPGFGLAPRLVSAALESQSHQAEFRFVPWVRAYRMSLEGQVDGTFPWSGFGDRDQYFALSAPILEHRISLIFAPERSQSWHDYNDLDGLHFGKVSGYEIGVDFYNWVTNTKQALETVNNEELLFRMLAYNRFDAAAFDQRSAREFIRLLQQEVPAVAELTVEPNPIEIGYSFILMPLNSQRTERLQQLLSDGFAAIKANGTYAAIMADY